MQRDRAGSRTPGHGVGVPAATAGSRRDPSRAPRGTLTPFPAPSRPEPGPSQAPVDNLPAQATPLIGRDRDLAEVRARLLRPEVRLLTLTGSGGSGKTRLALAVAADLLDAFSGGVCFVDLSLIRDPDLVVSAIARPLGVSEAGKPPLFEMLERDLHERELLLVLDNCEHVLPGVVQVGSLLETCPALKVLATSRAALHVRWEHEWILPPLSVPNLTCLPTPEALLDNPAVSLFVQRAQAVRSDFRLTSGNARAVAELCVRLDGLPLAIELAAAWIKVVSPNALLARLERRFDLLVGGRADQTARHQALRAAIDWSYDLLDQPERVLLRRLAVFAGGWPLEAAEAVCAGAGVEPGTILDRLARLVDHSLVVSEQQPSGDVRYQLLETIRDYALERLQRHGEAGQIQRQHAAYCLAMAERASTRLHGPEQVASLDCLEQEHDNLRAALGWCLADGGPADLGLGLAAALWEFWSIRGYVGEGQRWLQEALGRGRDADPRVRAAALNGLGTLVWMRGDYGQSVRLLQESVTLSREIGDLAGAGCVLCQLSWAESNQNRAMALLDEALALVLEAGDRWAEHYVRFFRGGWLMLHGQGEAAVPWLEASASLAGELQDHRARAYSLASLGGVMQGLGKTQRAGELLREAVAAFRAVRDSFGLLVGLVRLATVATSAGQPARAARLMGAVEGLRRRTGTELLPSDQARHDRDATAARLVLGEAAFQAAWTEGAALPLDQVVAEEVHVAPRAASPRPYSGDPLSPREHEVAGLVAHGLTNRQIAERLVVSERTVDAHVEHIRAKLGLRSRAQLAAWAGMRGLVATHTD